VYVKVQVSRKERSQGGPRSCRLGFTEPRRDVKMFKVQQRMCSTCIYRPNSPLDIKELEERVKDPHMGFKEHRICHHSKDACCRGFWDRHKDEFPIGQIAQRLRLVEFVDIDTLGPPPKLAP
jgi:hypothetical protein